MRDVAIIGAGLTPCKGRWVEKTYYNLGQMAVKEAIADAKISIKDVDAVVYGIYNDIFELSAIPASSAPTPRCTAPEPSPGGPALPGNDTVARSSVVSASAVKTVPPRPAPVAVRARSTAKSAEPAPQSRSDHVLPLYARR